MSSQFWIGALIPPLIKWTNIYIRRFFRLTGFDNETKKKVSSKQYPSYFGLLYGLWIIALLSTGFIVLMWFMISGPVFFPNKSYAVPIFFGLINMIGFWFIFGALLDFVFWQVSSENFKDYVKFRMIKSGWGYEIKQQIITLIKLGIIYYVVVSPLIAYLLMH
ncbi:hypothetical protein C4577_06960 [Candidatus Parcubacteria bacterium]|nr:MAG: hypothetical protein C4577_06960 [Candidatus Parcubacteria bacterium]